MRRPIYFLILFTIALLISPANVGASTTWSVCAVGCDFATIQSAVDGASPGDTLDIFAETFVENIIVAKNLTLQGAGAGQTVVDGNQFNSVFVVESGVVVTMNGLTITNGNGASGGGVRNKGGTVSVIDSVVSNNTANAYGGGISSFGMLMLDNTVVSGNEADLGGGVLTLGNSLLTVSFSTFSANSAFIDGGAIYNSNGTLLVSNGSFAQNTAVRSGGAIRSDRGVVGVHGSTINGNEAGFSGGGIYSFSGDALTVSNSTFSGNSAGVIGGGINVNVDTATLPSTLNVRNSTFVGNSAAAAGGGINNAFGTVTLSNTIITNSLNGGDCGGVITGSRNLFDDATCGVAARPITNLDLNLADNGGPTFTHALLPGSNAIDAGKNAICAAPPVNAIDQRGEPRNDSFCDIGAFERQNDD